MPTIQVEIRIYRCDETQRAAVCFTLPLDPMLFLLGTADLVMMLQESQVFAGLVSSFQNRTVTELAQYGTPEELEATIRSALADTPLTEWEVLSATHHNVDQAGM